MRSTPLHTAFLASILALSWVNVAGAQPAAPSVGQQQGTVSAGRTGGKATLEVFADFQHATLDAASIPLGSGNGGDVGVRLYPSEDSRLGFGFRVGWFKHSIQYGQPNTIMGPGCLSAAGSAAAVAGDLYIHSRGRRAQAYVFAGLALFGGSHDYHFESRANITRDFSSLAADAGVGLKVVVIGGLAVVPEARVVISHHSSAQVGIGVTYTISHINLSK
jgi:hypothetical protein